MSNSSHHELDLSVSLSFTEPKGTKEIISDIDEAIEDLGSTAKDTKGEIQGVADAIKDSEGSFGSTRQHLREIKDILTGIQPTLSGISGSISAIKDAIGGLSSTEFFTNLAASLNEIRDATSAISSKDFSMNMSFASLNEEKLGAYRVQVRQYISDLQQAYTVLMKLNTNTAGEASKIWSGAGGMGFQGTLNLMNQLSAFNEALKSIRSEMRSSKSMVELEGVASRVKEYWDQITIHIEKAKSLGVFNPKESFGVFPKMPDESTSQAISEAEKLNDIFGSIVERGNEIQSSVGKAMSGEAAVIQQSAEQVKQQVTAISDAVSGESSAIQQSSEQAEQHAAAITGATIAEEAKARQSSQTATAINAEVDALHDSAQASKEDAEAAEDDADRRNAAIARVNKAIQSYEAHYNSWTSASTANGGLSTVSSGTIGSIMGVDGAVAGEGAMRSAYEVLGEYLNRLIDLGDGLKSGESSLEEFESGFKAVTAVITEAETAIRHFGENASTKEIAAQEAAMWEGLRSGIDGWDPYASFANSGAAQIAKDTAEGFKQMAAGTKEAEKAERDLVAAELAQMEAAEKERNAMIAAGEAAAQKARAEREAQEAAMWEEYRSGQDGWDPYASSSGSGAAQIAKDTAEGFKQMAVDAKEAERAEQQLAAAELAQMEAAERAKSEAIAAGEAYEKQAERELELAEKKKAAEAKATLAAQKESSNLMTKMMEAQQKYSAAGLGTSSAQYSGITDLISKLKEADAAFEKGDITLEKYRETLRGIDKDFTTTANGIKQAGEAQKSFGAQFVDSLKNMIPFLNAGRLAMQTVRVIKEAVKYAIEFDDALTQMQIVAGATESSITKFGNSMYATAQKIGASTTDLIDSATVFARLGYSLEESASLAEYTSMLSNVGDIDVSSAQDAITAIFKAFKDTDIANIEDVMDKMVEVGNNFPISVSQLAEGMNNAGSTLAAAGNSFDQSLALLAASNATVQNISKASTGLRTITARLRKSKTELDELGEEMTDAKYNEMVKALTDAQVSLTDQNGEFRNTYDILKDIAAIWDTLGKNEQAALAELAAGTRQQNVFFSLMQNFGEAESAMDAMAGSTGALSEAYDTYLDSTTAHLNQFKAAWQELSTNLFDSSSLNGWIDTGTFFVNVLGEIIALVTRLTGGITGLGGAIVGVIGVIRGISAGDPITAVLSAIIGLISIIVGHVKEAKRVAVEAAGAFSEVNKAAESNLETLSKLSGRYKELSEGVDDNGNNVSLTKDEYAEYLGIVEQIVDISPRVVQGYDNEGKALLNYKGLIEEATEAQYEQIAAERELALSRASTTWGEYQKSYKNAVSPDNSAVWDTAGYVGALLEQSAKEGDTYVDKLQRLVDLMKGAGIEIKEGLLDASGKIDISSKAFAEWGGSYAQFIAANMDAIYANREAFYNYIGSLRDTNGEYIYSTQVINNLKTALYGLQTVYKDLSQNERDAVDLLYAWAQSQTGERGYFGSIPLNQLKAFKSGLAGVLDMSKSWDENTAAVDEYGQAWVQLNEEYKQLVEWHNQGFLSDEGFESRVKNLGVGLNQAARNAFQAYLALEGLDEAIKHTAQDVEKVTTKQDRFTDAMRKSMKAIDELKEALSGGDLDDHYKVLVESIDAAIELLESGQVGSAKLAAIKSAWDISDLNPEETLEYMKAMQRYFTEGSDGVRNFLTDLSQMDGEELAKYGVMVEKIGDQIKLSFDSDQIEAFASQFNMSGKAFIAFLEKLSMYSDNFTIDGKSMEEYRKHIEETNEELSEPETKEVTVDVTNKNDVDTWVATNRTMPVTVSITNREEVEGIVGGKSGNNSSSNMDYYYGNASGTMRAKRGMSLLGDEYSPGGQPKPELVVGKNGAYLAGTEGPTVGYLDSGDQVYTYDETKKILSGRGITKLGRFARGRKSPLFYPVSDEFGDLPKVNSRGTFNLAEILSGLGGDKGGSGSGSGAVAKSVEDIKKEFEDLYKYHKHLVAMDQEEQEDFLDWLEGAYKDAYEQGAIELDDFRKYEEEVYKGRMDLVKEFLKDLEHQIEMMTNAGADDNSIINVYLQMMDKIEKEIQDARDRGLDDNDDYIQELQNNWWNYYDKIQDMRDDSEKEAKDGINDLVQYRIKMIKQELNNEKDALKDRLDYLKEFYDKQKQLLRDEADEEDYQNQQAEKRKAVSDIEAQIKQLQFDDSAAAQKRRLQLQEDLLKAKKDLEDFEKDRALEIAEKQIDTLYENQEKQINDTIEDIEKQLNDPKGLYERALADVQNNSIELYEAMIDYNNRYGTGIKEDIVDMWEEAYISLKRYFDLYGEYYKGINLVNATGYAGPITGNIPRSVRGYAHGTRNATAGIHKFGENGDELIFTSADGTKYRMFQSGEKVLNASATNFLYDFAASGGAILSGLFDKAKTGFDMLRSGAIMGDVVMGDIIIQGNASDKTVSEIRRAQRDGVDYLLRKFAQLNA